MDVLYICVILSLLQGWLYVSFIYFFILLSVPTFLRRVVMRFLNFFFVFVHGYTLFVFGYHLQWFFAWLMVNVG